MEEQKSKIVKTSISVSLASRFVRHILPFVLFLVFGGFTYVSKNFNLVFYLISFYFIASIVIISYTNPSIIFKEDSVIISYPLLFSWKSREFNYSEIKLITFRHEPKINECFIKSYYRIPLQLIYQFTVGLFVPYEYKWFSILANGKRMKIYCFGLEYDYYDNSDDYLFENLKLDFSFKQVPTLWTANNDPYFSNK